MKYILFFIGFNCIYSSLIFAQDAKFDSSASDSALEAELARMLLGDEDEQPKTESVFRAQSSSSRGGMNMNPNIGIISKFTADALADGEFGQVIGEGKEGFTLHEVEISYQMVIDPYARADIFMAVIPDEEAVELEEAFITLLELPSALKAKIGIFRSKFGRLNQIHPPEVPFADYPLPLEMYFGDEGLVETGISISYLVPNPWDLFWESTFEVTNGDNETAFNGNATNDIAYTGHLTTFWDMGENATIEFGGSVASGKNDNIGIRRTGILGVDLTYKWKPLRQGLYRSFVWQSEFFLVSKDFGASENAKATGFYSYLQWQLGRRWFVLGRYDRAEQVGNADKLEQKYISALTFFPSAFQTIRLQSTTSSYSNGETSTLLSLQINFAIGAHGAHNY